jgi:hypothetical protein
MRPRHLLLIALFVLFLALATAWPLFNRTNRGAAAVDIFASPIQGGCYIAGPSECRLHVEPFTINLASGKKLVFFELVTIQIGTGTQRVIYDFRTDASNPVPFSGSTYTPSLVTQDFAATCGSKYEISLQGQDSGDSGPLNLGLTGQIQCPSAAP